MFDLFINTSQVAQLDCQSAFVDETTRNTKRIRTCTQKIDWKQRLYGQDTLSFQNCEARRKL